MAKRPENMTPDERLTRIRSLERKVRELENRLHWAERQEVSVRHWAEEAWKEVRRLHEVCERHWEVRQEARKLAGLDPEPSLVHLATFDHESRQWVPVGDPAVPGGRDREVTE